jgi:hypothetical protein
MAKTKNSIYFIVEPNLKVVAVLIVTLNLKLRNCKHTKINSCVILKRVAFMATGI